MAEIRIGVQQKSRRMLDAVDNSQTMDRDESERDQNYQNIRTERESNRKQNTESKIRQNFPKECEDAINQQINKELYAKYIYLSMAYYFQREDIALPGCFKFFKKCSDEEQEHAEKFMKYLNERGGRIKLRDIKKPERDEWGSIADAMTAALELEKEVNQSILDIHKISSQCEDAQTCNFLESEYLPKQVEDIKELADYISNLKRVGKGLGEYIFDKETLGGEDSE